MTITETPYRTEDEAVEIAQDLAKRFRKRVDETESLRRVADENVAELLESGLIRLETPRRWGGAELNIDAFIRVAATLSEGCGSTGWVYSLWSAHVWHMSQYPEHVQEKVLTSPKPIVSSCVNTGGRAVARPVDGGYILSSRGNFSSGVDHADWLETRVDLSLKEDEPPERYWFLVPRSQITIVDDWHTVGLRGSGSKSIIVDEVFVPEDHKVHANKDFDAGKQSSRVHDAPLFHSDGQIAASLSVSAPSIGIARAMVKEFEERCRSQGEAVSPAALLRLAKAAAAVDSAEALMLADARKFCYMKAAEITDLKRGKVRRDRAYISQLCRHTANDLFEASGSNSVYENSTMARLWRDSNVASGHAGARWDTHGLNYGKLAIGMTLPYTGSQA